jgi:hypothetical protein
VFFARADLIQTRSFTACPQRHLGFAFDPSTFAHAILEFTAAHNI